MANQGKDCPRLTVAMIVRDAEAALLKTLESVRTIADEVVVVDTGSLDGSFRLAQQNATHAVAHAWQDDFSAARNAALSLATGDWILWLDAGETLQRDTATELRTFLDLKATTDTTYYLFVRLPRHGSDISGEQIARLRLHPRAPGVAFTGRVRESIVPSLATAGFKTEGLSFVIDRGAGEHLPATKQARAERNTKLAKLAMQELGESADLHNCLGEAAQWRGRAAESIEHYRRALELAAPKSNEQLEAYYGLLTALEGREAARDAQLQLCLAALEAFPLDAQLLCAVGGYLQARGELQLAMRSYQVAVEHGQMELRLWHLEGLHEIALHCLINVMQMLGRASEAIEILKREVAENPEALRLHRQLLEIYIKQGLRDEALHVVNGLPRAVTNREALRNAVRGACFVAQQQFEAGQPLLEQSFKSGCRDTLCLKALAECYLAAGEVAKAEQIMSEWKQQEPHHPELRRLSEQRARLKSTPTVRIDTPGTQTSPPTVKTSSERNPTTVMK